MNAAGLARLVDAIEAAGIDYTDKAIAYQSDCNLRRLKRPDEKRKRLRAENTKAFNTLMALLKK